MAPQLLRHDGVVPAEILEGRPRQFVPARQLDEAFHRQLILTLNVLEHDEAAPLVFDEQFGPDKTREKEEIVSGGRKSIHFNLHSSDSFSCTFHPFIH